MQKIKLHGNKNVYVEVFETYHDEGASSYKRWKDNSEKMQIYNNVDTSKIGEYEVVYQIGKKKEKRKVVVVDTKKPVITLLGDKEISVFEGEMYEEPGFECKDAYDGDLSENVLVHSNIKNKPGSYYVRYRVSDFSGNFSEVKRKVRVFEDPTRIKVKYHYDNIDNKSEQWWFEKSKNHERNKGALPESVIKPFDSFYLGKDEKVIYLTFDEGGNEITYIKEITDVLNRNDVKATFFLTRNYIKKESEFMRELVDRGHIIGNHTRRHPMMPTLANADDIDKFVLEITETEKTYMEVTGKEMVKVFRFPSGDSSLRAMKIVQDLGYRNYFWSHAYYDFMEDVSKNEAFTTLMKHYHNGAIYLLHPSNKGNFEAMNDFIVEMKKLGFRFGLVDEIK